MLGSHLWVIGVAASASIVGLTVISGLVLLARRVVHEFCRPHELLSQDQFTWIMPPTQAEPPRSNQRRLTFETRDGKLLCGDFWAQPHSAPTVIICHGYRVPSVHLRPVAALEYQCGYNVLLFDFRGHGESDSVVTSGGSIEVRDFEAALTAAKMQPETLPNKIIIHGFSMGASIALLSSPCPEIAAIIADSPYARSDEILRRVVLYRLAIESTALLPFLYRLRHVFPAIAWAIVVMSSIIFRLRFGHTLIARPIASFKRWKLHAKATSSFHSIPILLIHATGDKLIPIAHSHQLVAEAQVYDIPLETYFVDHSEHCGAYGCDPEHYTTVIQQFLSRHLQDDFPTQQRLPVYASL